MEYREYHPPHIYADNTIYFISSGTLHKDHLFDTEEKKELLRAILENAVKKHLIKLYAWTILSNHYHLLLKVSIKESLYKLIKNIHGASATGVNKLEQKLGRQVWYNYWDRCIRDEKDYWRHFNYIHNNPIKHGYVYSSENLSLYKFSSYNYYLREYGEEWLTDVMMRYPVVDFSVGSDEF